MTPPFPCARYVGRLPINGTTEPQGQLYTGSIDTPGERETS